MFAESSLTPFPKGANMHSPCPTCFSSLGLHVWVPRLLLSPLVLLTFLTALWTSVRLRTPLGLQPCGLKNDLLAQQASLSLQPPEDP